MPKTPTIRVEITYSWEFSPKQWDETLEHLENLEEVLKNKIEWDGVSAFFNLRNIHRPTIEKVKVTKV